MNLTTLSIFIFLLCMVYLSIKGYIYFLKLTIIKFKEAKDELKGHKFSLSYFDITLFEAFLSIAFGISAGFLVRFTVLYIMEFFV